VCHSGGNKIYLPNAVDLQREGQGCAGSGLAAATPQGEGASLRLPAQCSCAAGPCSIQD